MKTKSARTAANRQILEEAAAWFVDFRVGDVGAAAREECHRWLRRSPEHIQAYLEIASTYAELPAPNPGGSLDIDALIAHARSSPGNIVEPSSWRQQSSRPSHTSRILLALAASILLVLGAISTWFYTQRGTYRTDIGEQRSLTLADGSTLELNSNSVVRVRYTERERHIDLLAGQALFDVAKDKARPFIVKTGDTQVRAVGTQFDVYRKSRGTTVTVIEGRVAVLTPAMSEHSHEDAAHKALTGEPPDGPGRGPDAFPGNPKSAASIMPGKDEILLSAGEQLTVAPAVPSKPATDTRSESSLHINHANIAAATAWTTRQLVFDATPLADVAEEFNRHNNRRLIVDMQQLADFHVSGTYSFTNPNSLLLFLRSQPGIKLVETEREIRVMRQ